MRRRYGSIGAEVARLSAPMFGRVVAGDPRAAGRAVAPPPLDAWTADDHAVYAEADVVVLTFADHSAATAGLVGAKACAAAGLWVGPAPTLWGLASLGLGRDPYFP
jgi:phosphoglycerate dehydrogenase-like enzyme